MSALALAPRPAAPTPPAHRWFRDVIAAERSALDAFLAELPEAGIAEIVDLLAAQERPIVCLGMGKSGLIAAKLAATLSSLGTPAFVLNAGEAAHGDLGAVQTGNVVILFSNSGATEEIVRILPLLKSRDCKLVGIIGRGDSPLARAVDHLIAAHVEAEADHIGMAPTSSTTLSMAIGDALAVAVSRARNFTREDFLRHHPAGLLGRQMIPVRTLMRQGEDLPVVLPSASVAELLAVMSGHRMGAACVIDHDAKLIGLVTDGDIRRHLQARKDLYTIVAHEVMQPKPRVVGADATLGDVLLGLGQTPGILVLPVVDPDGRLQGMLHANDLLQR
ncbi:SIS domain-containing protein [Sphingosinicella sp. BN140058]|uniref:KpsF/GutQ family sugar-phosphate isomerase n=1 Tax=Sphingosinicella sp. BN140058 TaxID=1892855 RepID=UPI00101143E1|nr:KpsF/GutQ family sugar-phosphate isomerase [Sphingosinicella sp. BN140058]QAY76996.1 KpsF/GutQ family sugar-phosphate isomerase [Sphingosinicella sp. BN140058]